MNGYVDRATAFADCAADPECCAVSETNHPGNDANKDTGDKFRLGTCGGWEDHAKWNSCVEVGAPLVPDVEEEDPEATPLPDLAAKLEAECTDDEDDGDVLPPGVDDETEGSTCGQEMEDQAEAGEPGSAKLARQHRRTFNKAYFRSKRDCSIDRFMEHPAIAPCECQMRKVDENGNKLKRREKFEHCDHSARSRECIDCEKSRFLHYLGCEVPGALSVVAQVDECTDAFCLGIQTGDIQGLRDAGYRVHPQQAMRWLNQGWEDSRCECVKDTQECDKDGVVRNKITGDPENIGADGRACRNEKYHEVIDGLKAATFSEKR